MDCAEEVAVLGDDRRGIDARQRAEGRQVFAGTVKNYMLLHVGFETLTPEVERLT